VLVGANNAEAFAKAERLVDEHVLELWSGPRAYYSKPNAGSMAEVAPMPAEQPIGYTGKRKAAVVIWISAIVFTFSRWPLGITMRPLSLSDRKRR
jgi:hypothetical protein